MQKNPKLVKIEAGAQRVACLLDTFESFMDDELNETTATARAIFKSLIVECRTLLTVIASTDPPKTRRRRGQPQEALASAADGQG